MNFTLHEQKPIEIKSQFGSSARSSMQFLEIKSPVDETRELMAPSPGYPPLTMTGSLNNTIKSKNERRGATDVEGNRVVPNWKPWCYHPVYLIFLIAIQVACFAALEVLVQKSKADYLRCKLDLDVATKCRQLPPGRGVCDVREEMATAKETAGCTIFAFREETTVSWVLWQFVPTIIAIINGLLWEIVYTTVCRLEPYYQLSKPEGADAQHALLLDYVGTFTFFVPFQAFKLHHWAVAVASLAYIFTFSIATSLTAGLWHIIWPQFPMSLYQDLGTAVVEVQGQTLRALQVFNLATAVLGVALLVILMKRKTGLAQNIGSIMDVAKLVADTATLNVLRQIPSYASYACIEEALGSIKFQLNYYKRIQSRGSSEFDCKLQTLPETPGPLQLPEVRYRKSHFEAHPIALWCRSIWIVEFIIIIPAILVYYGVATHVFSAFGVSMIYSFILVINSAMWGSMQRAIAMIQPFFRLKPDQVVIGSMQEKSVHPAARFRPSNVQVQGKADSITPQQQEQNRTYVTASFLPGGTFLLAVQSVRRLNYVLWIVVVANFAVHTIVVVNPPLLNVAYYEVEYGIPRALRQSLMSFTVLKWIILALGPIAVFSVLLSRRTRVFMPRKPNTLISKLLYVCNSTALLSEAEPEPHQDGFAVADEQFFSFGWFQDEAKNWFLGIDKRDHLAMPYKFGEILDGDRVVYYSKTGAVDTDKESGGRPNPSGHQPRMAVYRYMNA